MVCTCVVGCVVACIIYTYFCQEQNCECLDVFFLIRIVVYEFYVWSMKLNKYYKKISAYYSAMY